MGAPALETFAATDPLVTLVVGTILGGGLLSAVVALIRAKPQGQLDVMNAAKVLYDQQEKDIERCGHERDELAARCDKQRTEIHRVRHERDIANTRCHVLESALRKHGIEVPQLPSDLT